MAKKSVHTVPNAKGKGWVNKSAGQVTSRHRTKAAAVAAGRQQAKSARTEHRIHNTDGQIGRCNSYGGDPNPPRDKNR